MKNLTVGIPVFNEIDHIEKTVDNVVNLASKVDFEIELLIVDNFSSDGTRKYLEKLNDKFFNVDVRIILNDMNMGFTHSCDTLMNEAKGKYLWIIGGHDLINTEGLNSIKSIVEYDPDYVICNARIRDENSNEIINESLWGKTKSEDFLTLKDFFQVMGGPCQAISCNIYKTEKIKKYTGRQQVTHLWGFIERVMDMLIESESRSRIRYIDTPLVEMLIETNGWQVKGEENFGLKPAKTFGAFTPVLQISELYNDKLKSYPEELKHAAPFRDKLGIARTIVVAKSEGLPVSVELWKKLCGTYRKSLIFWLVGLPIFLAPRWVSRILLLTKGIVHVLRRVFRIKTY
jgi:glycosyltransferase involved in cell wall biosynthesis